MDLLDGLKHRQALGHRLIVVQEGLFVRRSCILGLQLEDLGLVEVSVELVEDVVLVSEHAARPIQASFLRVECPAILGLEHVSIGSHSFVGQLVLPVGKVARVSVPTLGSLDPVPAKSGLEVAARARAAVLRDESLAI